MKSRNWKWGWKLAVVCILTVIAVDYYIYCVPNKEVAPYLQSLNRAKQLTIWEGLPHQHYDPDLLKSELASKQTVVHHGFPFYDNQREMANYDARQIKWILAWPRYYRERRKNAAKACGGYHPDYVIEWNDSDGIHQIHLCLGCFDVKLYSPSGEASYDLNDSAAHQLRAMLKSYRDQRPKSKLLD